MAQFLFDALTASVSSVDNQAVFAVQSLLDNSQIGTNAGLPTTTFAEDEDIFFCGKCKKQFTSLSLFIGHKKEHCCSSANAAIPAITHPSSSSTNTQTIQLAQQVTQHAQIQPVPSSQLATLTPGVVLSEADLLSLTNIDQNIATIANCPTVQTVSSTAPQLQHVSLIGQPEISQQSEQQHNSQSQPHIQAHAVGLSLLTNTFVSTPLFVNSQCSPNSGSNVQNMVLSISNPPLSKDVLLSPAGGIGLSAILSKSDSAEQLVVDAIQTSQIQDVTEKNIPQGKETEITVVGVSTNIQNKSKKRGSPSTDSAEGGSKKAMKLKCNYCDKQFVKNFDLQQHLRCHTGDKPFQCIVCGRAFAQKSNVKKHMQTHKVWPDGLAHTLPKLADIDPGETEAGGNDNQIEQVATENANCEEAPKGGYVCPYCTFTGRTYFDLKSHMKKHKQEKVYKCIVSTCGQMYHDLDTFLDHIKSHETEMSYRCHQCNKTFKNLYELGSHQYSHRLYPNRGSRTQQRYFRCSQCLNKYATPAALDHHMATSSHNYSCPFPSCDKVFPCERYLRRHLHIHGTSNIYKCKNCGKGFKTQHYLKVHLLTHSLFKPFMCEQCGAAFNRRDKLKRHHLIHEPIKRLKCPFRALAGCPREFNRSDKLKAHILTHSCIKPYVCKLCGRTFTRKSHLRDHERIHSENNNLPYHCKRCGKGFESENILKDHECADISMRKRKVDHKYYNSLRIKKLKNYGKNCENLARRRPGRPRKSTQLVEKEQEKSASEVNDLDTVESDDIPTAHIEIISTSEDLGPGSVETVEIPLAVANSQLCSNLLTDSTHFSSATSSSGIITNKFHIDSAGNVTLPDGGELPSFPINKPPPTIIKICGPKVMQNNGAVSTTEQITS